MERYRLPSGEVVTAYPAEVLAGRAAGRTVDVWDDHGLIRRDVNPAGLRGPLAIMEPSYTEPCIAARVLAKCRAARRLLAECERAGGSDRFPDGRARVRGLIGLLRERRNMRAAVRHWRTLNV